VPPAGLEFLHGEPFRQRERQVDAAAWSALFVALGTKLREELPRFRFALGASTQVDPTPVQRVVAGVELDAL
jgi:hypothetical protein